MKRILLILFAFLIAQPGFPHLCINELMQSNLDGIMDDLHEFPDSWVELYNPDMAEDNLSNYSIGLTADVSKAYKLPKVPVYSKGFSIIYCDKENKILHTDFRLESEDGGSVYLFCNGVVVDKWEKIPAQPFPNVAYGKKTETSTDKGWLLTATPSAPNCGQLAKACLAAPKFSTPGGLISGKQRVELTLTLPDGAPSNAVIRFTIDGTEPTEQSSPYSSTLYFTGSLPIKARTFAKNCLSAPAHTESYLRLNHATTLPVVSIVMDERYLTDENIGIYVAGKDPNWANYRNDWRRPANFELFEHADTASVINQICETRIQGGASRDRELKSMIVYANKRFGKKNFKHEIFPDDKPGVKKFKSLLLRNAGNDYDGLYMRDALMQRSVGRYVDLDWQAYKPAVIFINGQYRGIINIRERSNDHNIEANYGIEDVDVIENNYDVKAGDGNKWWAFQTFFNEHGHTWDEYETWMDCQEYINLMVLNLFYDNVDFPGNNVLCWRPRNAEDGMPTRWRWVAKDCEFGLGIYGASPDQNTWEWFYNPDYDPDHAWANTSDATRLFRRLMEDSTFFNRFVDCALAYMGDFLNYDRIWPDIWEPMYLAVIDEYAWHRDLYFHDNPWWPNYPNDLKTSREWLQKRPAVFTRDMAKKYDLGEPVNMSIVVDNASPVDTLAVNNVRLSRPAFSGMWLPNRTITLTSPNPMQWDVTIGTEHQTVPNGKSCTFVSQAGKDIKVVAHRLTSNDASVVKESQSAVRKVMINGQIYIIKDDRTYTISGEYIN